MYLSGFELDKNPTLINIIHALKFIKLVGIGDRGETRAIQFDNVASMEHRGRTPKLDGTGGLRRGFL